MVFFKKLNGLLYKLLIAPYYRFSFAEFGHNSRIIKPTAIDGPKRIFIGPNVLVSHFGWLAANPLTGSANCKLEIGEGTYIGRFCHIYATSRINIGKKVLMADKVYISDNLHGYKDIQIPVIDQPIRQVDEVTVGDGSWLGENACIIGASVGRHSIIGANSVVTKNIPDYCIAVGAPAVIIKRYNHSSGHWEKTNAAGEFI